MTSHYAIDCGSYTAQGGSDDVNPPPDESTTGEEVGMDMDTHIKHTEPIFADGDLFVILLSHEKSFIAGFQLSSIICCVASKTISTLIDTSSTQNGRKVARLYDCVDLEVDAFRCIFSVLHYTNTGTYRHLAPKDLLQVARINSILDCGKALEPWICLWCDSIRHDIGGHDQPKTEELGMLLSSAITFKADEEVVRLVAFASHHLPMNFLEIWKRNQDLKDLPENKFLNELHTSVAKLFSCTFELIHSIDGVLSSQSSVYTTGRRLCPSCGRRHPSTAKKCHPCHEVILWSELCTKQHRIGDYLRILTEKRLWPLNILLKDDTSVSLIVQRVTSMALNIPHTCKGGTQCPMFSHINGVFSNLKRTVDEVVSGVQKGGEGKVDCDGDNGVDAAGSSNDNVAN
ncbi:hypothetical protein LY76DRAFT_623251 [Colletotrichum caudatum]|nr:hypothetical protein LY76DRAFT_623251 [Colletotrichum caudatum]